MSPQFTRSKRHKFITDKAFKKGLPLVSDSTIAVYLKEISDLKPLSREMEKKLGKKILKGNHEALNELVKHNLKYVVHIANKYRGCGISICDLINEGNIGLIQSAGKFDPGREVKFITYAAWWIRQAIMHAIANNSGSVRLPIKQAGVLAKIEEKFRQLAQIKERDPTVEELSKEIGVKAEDLECILRVYRTHLSLNTPLKNQLETSYMDFLVEKNPTSMETLMIQQDLISRLRSY